MPTLPTNSDPPIRLPQGNNLPQPGPALGDGQHPSKPVSADSWTFYNLHFVPCGTDSGGRWEAALSDCRNPEDFAGWFIADSEKLSGWLVSHGVSAKIQVISPGMGVGEQREPFQNLVAGRLAKDDAAIVAG